MLKYCQPANIHATGHDLGKMHPLLCACILRKSGSLFSAPTVFRVAGFSFGWTWIILLDASADQRRTICGTSLGSPPEDERSSPTGKD
jgi:hypothetical protein